MHYNRQLTGLEENEEIYNKEKCPIQPIADRGFLTLKSACSNQIPLGFVDADWLSLYTACIPALAYDAFQTELDKYTKQHIVHY